MATTVAVLGLAGCASGPRDPSGLVTSRATTDTYSVRVGDCLAKLPTDSAAQLTLLPCDQEHYWEVFASATLTGDTFPGESSLRKQAQSACEDAFDGFVGLSVKKSKLDITMLTPTRQTWAEASDREVTCLVGSTSGGVTGTLHGAAR